MDKLHVFVEGDTTYTGVPWIMQEDVRTVPEWISRIREQLSVSYAGLGMKYASDYNQMCIRDRDKKEEKVCLDIDMLLYDNKILKPEDWQRAVSYTHLDVYKRQVYDWGLGDYKCLSM